MHTIWTYGYSDSTLEQLRKIVRTTNAMLVDIRYRAASSHQVWQQTNIIDAVGGDKYWHCADLGNRNYRGNGPIHLDNPERALPRISALLEQQDVLLLCACPSDKLWLCHRWTVGHWLARRIGAPLQHIQRWPHVESADQTLECHSQGDRRFSALYAQLAVCGQRTIEQMYQSRKRDATGLPFANPKGQWPRWIEAQGLFWDADTHLHDYYAMLWAIYFHEQPHLLRFAKQYSHFRDIFDRKQGLLYTPCDVYPQSQGVCQSAAIAAWIGGYSLSYPWNSMLATMQARHDIAHT